MKIVCSPAERADARKTMKALMEKNLHSARRDWPEEDLAALRGCFDVLFGTGKKKLDSA